MGSKPTPPGQSDTEAGPTAVMTHETGQLQQLVPDEAAQPIRPPDP